jgi:two-component system cell cycle response regulator DivK
MEKDTLILIIDDDSRNIFALSLVLKARGFKCISALKVEDGLALLEQYPETSIILMDMMMPDIDGYEAIRLINSHQKHKKLPIIAVTAQAMQGDKERCLEAGAWGYISKPVDIDKLLAEMQKVIINDRTKSY